MSRENVIWVLDDDDPFHTFVARFRPRTFKLLCSRGLVFDAAYVPDPLCTPTRVSMQTGRKVSDHGIRSNSAPGGGFDVYRERRLHRDTIGTRMQALGYATAYVGKYMNDYEDNGGFVPPGWHKWVALCGDLNDREQFQVSINGDVRAISRSELNETDFLAREAVEFLKNRAGGVRPVFLFFAPHSPHGPYTPASRHQDDFDNVGLPGRPNFNHRDPRKPPWIANLDPLTAAERARIRENYEGKLEEGAEVDDAHAKVMNTVFSTALAGHTFVFGGMTDNGYALGEHRIARGKGDPYEEESRSALAVYGPSVPVGRSAAPVSLLDVHASTLEIAGGDPSQAPGGRSILEHILDPSAPPQRNYALVEHFAGHGYYMIRTADRVYVEHETGQTELYDMVNDPYQKNNVAEDRPREVAALHDLLAAAKAA